jgi:hypothetical protein
MTMTTATGLPAPDELAEAIGHLAQATGHSLFGARLALAKGDVRTAYWAYMEHRRLVLKGSVPCVIPGADQHDGLSPEELLRRTAELPPSNDVKRGLK